MKTVKLCSSWIWWLRLGHNYTHLTGHGTCGILLLLNSSPWKWWNEFATELQLHTGDPETCGLELILIGWLGKYILFAMAVRRQVAYMIQGVFFNWYPPKNHKYGKMLKYQNWYPPKNHKYGKKLKYQNWYPPIIHKYGKKLKYQNWYPPSNSQVSVDPAPDHAESWLPAQLLSLKPNMVVLSWT